MNLCTGCKHTLVPYPLLVLPLWGVLAAGAAFSDEKYAATSWTAVLCIALLMLWIALRRGYSGISKFDAVEWCGLALIGWCTLIDLREGSYASFTIVCRLALLAYLAVARRTDLRKGTYEAIILSVTAAVAICQLASRSGIAHLLPFDNTAGFGAALAMGLPIVLDRLLSCKGTKVRTKRHNLLYAFIYAALTLLVITALWATPSRTAWIAALVATGWLLLRRTRIIHRLKPMHRFLAGLACLAILLMLTAALYRIRPASADGRLLVYRVTANSISEAPLTGHGRDGILRDYMPAQAAFLQHHPHHPATMLANNVPYVFNELLALCFRYGLGGVAMLLLGLALCRRRASGTPAAVSAALTAFVVMCLTSYPTSYPFLTLLALLSLAAARPVVKPAPAYRLELRKQPLWQRLIWIIPAALTLLVTGRRIRDEHQWVMGSELITKGKADAGLSLLGQANAALADRPDFLYSYAAELNLAGRTQESLTLCRRLTRHLNDCDTETLIADDLMAAERYREALPHLITAHHMVPARLTPLYGLLLCHEALGDTAALRKAATRLAAYPVKVPSSDAKAMQEAAREILRKYPSRNAHSFR